MILIPKLRQAGTNKKPSHESTKGHENKNFTTDGFIEDPRSDSTALGHEQIGLELTAERLGPNGARRSQATGNALAFTVQKGRPLTASCATRI